MDIWIVVLWIMILIIFALMIFFWYDWKTYKHGVVIREIASGRKIIITTKACDFKDRDGLTWWKLRGERDKLKRLMPIPPSVSIDITRKGKKHVECYRTEMGEYIFISDTATSMTVPEELIDGLMKNLPKEITELEAEEKNKAAKEYVDTQIKEWKKENNVVEPLKPLTKEERMIMVSQIKRAEEERGKDWKQDLPIYVSIASFTLFFICLLLFMPDIITTVRDMNTQYASGVLELENTHHKHEMEYMERESEMINNIQRIQENLGIEDGTIPD